MNCVNGHPLKRKFDQSHLFRYSEERVVWLHGVETRSCQSCAEFEIVIPRVLDLERLIVDNPHQDHIEKTEDGWAVSFRS